MGLNVMQLVRVCGASKAIGVDVREEPLALSRKLGVDITIDGRKEDPVELVREVTQGAGADVVISLACISLAPRFPCPASSSKKTRPQRDGSCSVVPPRFAAGLSPQGHEPCRRPLSGTEDRLSAVLDAPSVDNGALSVQAYGRRL